MEPQGEGSGTMQSVVNRSIESGKFIEKKQSEATGGVSKPRHLPSGDKRPVKQTSSCPPGRAHSVSVGPWSLEWVNRHKSHVKCDVRPLETRGKHPTPSGVPRVLNKKGSGYIRHCAQNLKQIVRLSEKDRKEVLHALRKSHRRHKRILEVTKDNVNANECSSQSGSHASVNNDWTNWLVLHGCDKVMLGGLIRWWD